MKQLFKSFKKKEKGVSAVIGTILMVAITVVTATAVFMYVGGYFTGTPSKPQSLLLNEKNSYGANYGSLTAQFTVTQGSLNTPFMIKIVNTATGQVAVQSLVNSLTASTTLSFTLPGSTTTGATFTIPGTASGSTITITPSGTIYDNNGNGKLDSGDSIVLTLTGSTAINVNSLDQYAFEITTTSGSVLYTYQFDF
ncbi:MAG: type IV pilin [Euryarchaeota archaeon]|nr:type IV pilin [Euryarchaeota archaeon]